MESRSYMFATAKKRSTLLSAKGIEYVFNNIQIPKRRFKCTSYVNCQKRMS